MLPDSVIANLEAHLAAFKNTNAKNHNALQDLLQKYETMLDDYRSLRSDYKEENSCQEISTRHIRKQGGDPFLLVLVDGDSYIFHDNLIKDQKSCIDAGANAANLLSESVRNLTEANLGLGGDCRIVVRIYVDLVDLSRRLSRANIAGPEKRSLAPFVASFNNSAGLVDFVDAGEGFGSTSSKIKETFKFFSDNPQCRHIFFAACNSLTNITLLAPFSGTTDRVTLIKSASWSPEYDLLGLGIETLPNVFRSVPLANIEDGPLSRPTLRIPAVRDATPYTRESASPPATATSSTFLTTTSALDTFPPPASTHLIPLNAAGRRIDAPLHTPPSSTDLSAFQLRSRNHQLCIYHHLHGNCTAGPNCKFEHSPASPAELQCLRFWRRNCPCVAGAACRRADCINGHVCARVGCRGPPACKMKEDMHGIDAVVAEWAIPTAFSTAMKTFRGTAVADWRAKSRVEGEVMGSGWAATASVSATETTGSESAEGAGEDGGTNGVDLLVSFD